MFENGFVFLHRVLLDKPIWNRSTPEQKCILIALLLMASWKEKDFEFSGEKYYLKAGQFITSLEKIAEKGGKGISIQNVRTALLRFEKFGFLTNESTNQNRLITIINWEFYQKELKNQQTNQQATNKQPTSDQQATNKQLTTINKENKDNKGEDVIDEPKFNVSEQRRKDIIARSFGGTIISDEVKNFIERFNQLEGVIKCVDFNVGNLESKIQDIYRNEEYYEKLFNAQSSSSFLKNPKKREFPLNIHWFIKNSSDIVNGKFANKEETFETEKDDDHISNWINDPHLRQKKMEQADDEGKQKIFLEWKRRNVPKSW
jgi:hypothetical protein